VFVAFLVGFSFIGANVYAMEKSFTVESKYSSKKYMEEFDSDNSFEDNDHGMGNSRLERSISDDRLQEKERADSEDDEYYLQIEQNLKQQKEIQNYTESGKLLNYLIKDLEPQNDKIRNREYFTQTMVTYAEKLNSVQSTIEGAVAHIRCFFYETGRRYCNGKEEFYKKETILRDFKEELKLLITSQRELVHSSCNSQDIPLVTSIFKFYAKELFEKLMKMSCGQPIIDQYSSNTSNFHEKQEKQKLPAPTFETLYAWKVNQEMVMTIFKVFMNDLIRANYGGYGDSLTKKVREVATGELEQYLTVHLDFLSARYKNDRNSFTKLLNYANIKGSSTMDHFKWFLDKFEAKFTNKAFPNLDVLETKKNYLKRFEEDDSAFSKNVSETVAYINPLGWNWKKWL
jgi:hypothetical protein